MDDASLTSTHQVHENLMSKEKVLKMIPALVEQAVRFSTRRLATCPCRGLQRQEDLQSKVFRQGEQLHRPQLTWHLGDYCKLFYSCFSAFE